MPTSLVFKISISKPQFLVNNAVQEAIELFRETTYITKIVDSSHAGVFVMEVNLDRTCFNIEEMVMVVITKAKYDDSSSSLRMVLAYELENQAIHIRLINALFGKTWLRSRVLYHLLDFKKRVEKWS